MTEAVKDMLKILTDFLKAPLAEHGFTLKKDRYFESSCLNGRSHRYTLNLSKSKGWFSLHLTLQLLDPTLMKSVNIALNSALRDQSFEYPENWSKPIIEKTIRTRTSNTVVAELTDWRALKSPDETLEDFNERFSIWLYSFDHVDEICDWKKQLLESVKLALTWFKEVNSDDWIRVNTDYPSLYLLKSEGASQEFTDKYDAVLKSSENPQEAILFCKNLRQTKT